jgi:hypothetical protein
MKTLDRIFKNTEEHLVFWDEKGVLQGGVWILFNKKTNIILKILHNPEIGDILLAIDKDKQSIDTFEEMEKYCPDTECIIGIAIPTQEKPRNIGKYIESYFVNMINISDKFEINEYQSRIYQYIIEKVSGCQLRVQHGLTMTNTGLQCIK